MLQSATLPYVFFFSSRRRHTRWNCDWSSDVCSSDLLVAIELRMVESEDMAELVREHHGPRRVGDVEKAVENGLSFGELAGVRTRRRSEERRVGKECRSRWSPSTSIEEPTRHAHEQRA